MARHILIADPDPATARLLAPALRHRGHQVSAVRTGPRALETCVLRAPDLVLFDAACPLLDAQTFRQILRANPHTEQLPILVTGSSEGGAPLGLRDGFLLKPFNVDEVVARIDQTFRRLDAAQQTRRGDHGMEGALGQLGVTDLLQIFGQNRNSGVLRLSGPRGSARIRLNGGLIAEAQGENATGTKALYRLLQWRDGLFAFKPGASQEPGDIGKSVEELLLEGLRQADELPALKAALPEPAARLVLAPSAVGLTGDQHPITAEILELFRAGATVGEALERARATDYAAAQAMLTLLRKGILAPASSDSPPRREQRPLLPAGSAHALRARIQQLGRPEAARARGKLLLASDSTPPLAAFLERLAALPEIRLDAEAVRSVLPAGFGTLGVLDAGDDLGFDLLLLPASDAASPLWQPFSARALGAILLLEEKEDGIALARFLCREQGLPVVLPGRAELPAALAELERPPSLVGPEPADALRELLALVARLPVRPPT